MLEARKSAADLYRSALSDVPDLSLPAHEWEGGSRGWFVYVVDLPEGVERDGVIRGLRDAGVDCKPYLPSLHLMPHIAAVTGSRRGEFPVSERASDRGLALPFFPGITEEQISRVAAALARSIADTVRQ